MSVTAFIQHQVSDYDTWRKVYDEFADFQKEHGVTEESVHCAPGDRNTVMVLHRFASPADAQAFLGSTELRETMHEAGVEGQPRIEIYEDV